MLDLWIPIGRNQAATKSREDFRKPSAIATEADNANASAVQVACRAADEFVLLLSAKEGRQASECAGEERHGVIGHLVGEDSGCARHGYVGFNDRRHQTVVHASRGGLNPLEPTAADDVVPRDGHLGVAAVNVGCGEQIGDAFLAGVDDVVVGCGRGDLVDVARLGRVAKNDPGAIVNRWRFRRNWHNIGCGWIVRL